MKERKEKLIKEIKEVADRIEVKLGEYRTKYYKEIPVESKKKIYNWLKDANIQTEILIFEAKIQKYMYFSELIESISNSNSNSNSNITIIYNYLDNAVNEILKYYNDEFASSISDIIDSIKCKLVKSGYRIESEFKYLLNTLSVLKAILLYEEKYQGLTELMDIISIISNIDSIRPGTLNPDIHELYGVKTLLLELEENIKIIETMDSSCANVILEYIDYIINWNWFKEIR